MVHYDYLDFVEETKVILLDLDWIQEETFGVLDKVIVVDFLVEDKKDV